MAIISPPERPPASPNPLLTDTVPENPKPHNIVTTAGAPQPVIDTKVARELEGFHNLPQRLGALKIPLESLPEDVRKEYEAIKARKNPHTQVEMSEQEYQDQVHTFMQRLRSGKIGADLTEDQVKAAQAALEASQDKPKEISKALKEMANDPASGMSAEDRKTFEENMKVLEDEMDLPDPSMPKIHNAGEKIFGLLKMVGMAVGMIFLLMFMMKKRSH